MLSCSSLHDRILTVRAEEESGSNNSEYQDYAEHADDERGIIERLPGEGDV